MEIYSKELASRLPGVQVQKVGGPSKNLTTFSSDCCLLSLSFPFTWICPCQGCVFTSVQSLSDVRLFVTPWTAARQTSLSITNSQSLPKFISTESVMPSNHLILCHPLLLLPSIFPSIRVFSSESILHIRWPKYWSFSVGIGPSDEYSGLTSFRMCERVINQSAQPG